MIRQYPYLLFVKTVTDPVQNASGDFVGGSESWDQVSACRDEANSKGQVINLVDGTAHIFDSLVQLPKSCTDVTLNAEIEVRFGDQVRLKGICKRFSRDQFHCRLWV